MHLQSIKTVAFIGAGNMGTPMARCARRGCFDVMICDRDPSVRERFDGEGVPTTADAADCAAADAIIVLLANDAQIMDAVLGERGLVHAIPAGHRPVVCIMSTTLPDTLRLLEAALGEAGACLVDAPVSGGIIGAQEGTLTIMLGGSEADVERVQPLMRTMGARIFHCGAPGSAAVAKVINNMLCVATMYLSAEAIELAQAHGMSFETLAPILSVSTGMNFLTKEPAVGRAQYRAWAPTKDAYASIHHIVSKDLHLALALGDSAGLDLALLKQVSRYLDDGDANVAARWMRAGQAPGPT